MLGAREHPSGKIVEDRQERVKMLGLQLVDGCKNYPQKYPKDLWCVTIGLPEYTSDQIEADIIAERKKFKYLAVSSALPSSTAFAFKWLLLVRSRAENKSKGNHGQATVAVMLGEPLLGAPAPGTHIAQFGWNAEWEKRRAAARNPVLAFPIFEVLKLGKHVLVNQP
jgi:hypothetical protein